MSTEFATGDPMMDSPDYYAAPHRASGGGSYSKNDLLEGRVIMLSKENERLKTEIARINQAAGSPTTPQGPRRGGVPTYQQHMQQEDPERRYNTLFAEYRRVVQAQQELRRPPGSRTLREEQILRGTAE